MSEPREYRPDLMPRRGEINAWLVTLLLGAFFAYASSAWNILPSAAWAFEGLMVFFSASISLGNWVDRRTVLLIEADGIAFKNGLRNVHFRWPEVQNVAVVKTATGRRVQVQGEIQHFSFKSAGAMSMFGQSVSTGFKASQEILETILENCNMKLTKEADGVYYYARA